MKNKKVIASCGITNCMGIAIYDVEVEMDDGEQGVEWGYNDEPSQISPILYYYGECDEEEEGRPWFLAMPYQIFLDECIRTNIGG